MYAEDALLCHPLVSPLAAPNWEGSPPTHFACGEECLTDQSLFLATKMAKQDVRVVLDQYEAMPHCFALVIENNTVGKKCFGKWAGFLNAAVKQASEEGKGEGVLTTKGTWIVAKTNEERSMDVFELCGDSDEVVLERMRRVVEWGNVPEAMTNSKPK